MSDGLATGGQPWPEGLTPSLEEATAAPRPQAQPPAAAWREALSPERCQQLAPGGRPNVEQAPSRGQQAAPGSVAVDAAQHAMRGQNGERLMGGIEQQRQDVVEGRILLAR